MMKILSKAFDKSTNVQYNIFPRDIYIRINACKLNMLSNVLYPFLNSAWDSEIKPTSSDNSHNVSFRTEVKVLLGHDTNVTCLYD